MVDLPFLCPDDGNKLFSLIGTLFPFLVVAAAKRRGLVHFGLNFERHALVLFKTSLITHTG